MNSLKDTTLESNPYLKINFDGDDLSSDAGLLLIKEFAAKIGLVKLVYRLFKTNDDIMKQLNNESSPSLHSVGNSANLSNEDIRKLYENMLRDEILKDYTFPSKPSSDGYYHVYVTALK